MMSFTQKEIVEIKKHISAINVPIKYSEEKNSIILKYAYNIYILAILKKEDGYKIFTRNSDKSSKNSTFQNFNDLIYFLKKGWLQKIKSDNPFDFEESPQISKLSPRFYKIFKEAIIINYLGFEESSGMIFRKALEILVKDFLKNEFPKTYENLLNRKTIGQIIRHFYEIKEDQLIIKNRDGYKNIQTELEYLKSLAKIINITFKIGNDFSHYERRLTEFSANDMHERIIKISEFIERQLEVKKLMLKQTELKREFDTDKL